MCADTAVRACGMASRPCPGFLCGPGHTVPADAPSAGVGSAPAMALQFAARVARGQQQCMQSLTRTGTAPAAALQAFGIWAWRTYRQLCLRIPHPVWGVASTRAAHGGVWDSRRRHPHASAALPARVPCLQGDSAEEADDMTCAICLERTALTEIALVKGCEHQYCGEHSSPSR